MLRRVVRTLPPGTFFLLALFPVTPSGDYFAAMAQTSKESPRDAGDDATKIPNWIPSYPGSDPKVSLSTDSKDQKTGVFQFKTADRLVNVARFYENGFKLANLRTTVNLSEDSALVNADSDRKSAAVKLDATEGGTSVSVTFRSEK